LCTLPPIAVLAYGTVVSFGVDFILREENL